MSLPILGMVKADASGIALDSVNRQALRALAGKPITIQEKPERRSLDQNSYLHAEPFPKVAEFMGDDIDGAKLVLMGECWGWKRDPLTGREIPVKPRTSGMTVKECSYFIEWLPPWAFDHCDGLVILLPNEWERRGCPQYVG